MCNIIYTRYQHCTHEQYQNTFACHIVRNCRKDHPIMSLERPLFLFDTKLDPKMYRSSTCAKRKLIRPVLSVCDSCKRARGPQASSSSSAAIPTIGSVSPPSPASQAAPEIPNLSAQSFPTYNSFPGAAGTAPGLELTPSPYLWEQAVAGPSTQPVAGYGQHLSPVLPVLPVRAPEKTPRPPGPPPLPGIAYQQPAGSPSPSSPQRPAPRQHLSAPVAWSSQAIAGPG